MDTIEDSRVVTVEQAKDLILEHTKLLEAVEVSVFDAMGCVLSEDIISRINLPHFTNSSVDGYAVRSADIKNSNADNPVQLKVVGTIRAGDYPRYSIDQGESAKIMTGAPVPTGSDSVVMVEDTDNGQKLVKIKKPVSQNENLRFEGEEIRKGEIALMAGAELNPASLGFTAELGLKNISVYRKPRVALLVTGEELIGMEDELRPGKIRDTNSIIVRSALSRENAELIFHRRVKDEIADIREKLEQGLGQCDVVVVTGGVSVGEYDYVKEVLTKLGVKVVFWRVTQKPGGPMFFGTSGNALVFGLPGNPASALVCFYEYVRPALRKMAGKSELFLFGVEAFLVEEIRKKAGKTQFLRGIVERRNNSYFVKPSGAQGSHILKSFGLSNCLIVAGKDLTYLPQNSKVDVHLLPN